MTPPIQCTADSAGIADLMWAVASASRACVGECIGHPSVIYIAPVFVSRRFPPFLTSLAFISAVPGFFVCFSVLFLDFGVFLGYNRSND